MFGCYLYDFNMSKPSTPELVKWQLDFYYDKIKKGEAERIVFHTNAMADLGFEADEVALAWLEELGDPDNGIEPGTKFEDLPEDFECPLCGVGKDNFSEAE